MAGKIELVLCRTITDTHHRVTRCKARLVSGRVTFKLSGHDTRISVSRARTVFASGVGVPTGHGRLQLLLTPRRRLAPDDTRSLCAASTADTAA